ncbi:L,D-transpeptidase [Streptomyces sp. NPDC057743]|uniref:L,D-transpeptidase n=1 Tax=Streptomyces sp. NPDC057743 TaxID=3346236 RepID=UPI0036A2E465
MAALTGSGILLATACSHPFIGAPNSNTASSSGSRPTTSSSPTAHAKVTSGPLLGFELAPAQNAIVGTGQPVSLEFERPVKNKATVEKTLTVTALPATEGSWGWISTPSGRERLDWRPKRPWTPLTTVQVKGDLTTVDPGGAHFTHPVDRSFTIGRDQQLIANLDTKTLTIRQNGKPIRQIPVSGGEPVPGRASRPGTFAIKSREKTVHMTSASVGGPKHYDVLVNWGMRFTDTGGYLHQALPEAQANVGVHNRSAGCIGMTPSGAQWLFDNTLLGDLLTITGKEATTDLGGPGNGYADWSIDYPHWKSHSAQ